MLEYMKFIFQKTYKQQRGNQNAKHTDRDEYYIKTMKHVKVLQMYIFNLFSRLQRRQSNYN